MRKKIQGDYMMKVDCVSEAIHDSKIEGKTEGKIEIIKKWLNNNKITIDDAVNELISIDCNMEIISKVTSLSEKEIEEIKNQ